MAAIWRALQNKVTLKTLKKWRVKTQQQKVIRRVASRLAGTTVRSAFFELAKYTRVRRTVKRKQRQLAASILLMHARSGVKAWREVVRKARLVRKMSQRLQGRGLGSTFQEWVKWVLQDRAIKEREAFRSQQEAAMEKLRSHMAESQSTQNMSAAELAEARAKHDAAAAELRELQSASSELASLRSSYADTESAARTSASASPAAETFSVRPAVAGLSSRPIVK